MLFAFITTPYKNEPISSFQFSINVIVKSISVLALLLSLFIFLIVLHFTLIYSIYSANKILRDVFQALDFWNHHLKQPVGVKLVIYRRKMFHLNLPSKMLLNSEQRYKKCQKRSKCSFPCIYANKLSALMTHKMTYIYKTILL